MCEGIEARPGCTEFRVKEYAVPTVLYVVETCGMRLNKRTCVNVLVMKCLEDMLDCQAWT